MDKTYTYPAYIKGLGAILIVLSLILWGVLVIMTIADATTPIQPLIWGTLFLAAFSAFGWMLIRSSSVVITLSQDGITVANGRRQRFIMYGEITAVTHSSKVFTSMIFHTDGGNFAVRKNLVFYPEFVENLKPKVQAMRQDLSSGLQVKCRAWEVYVGAGIFIGASAVIWIVVLVALFTGESDIASLIFLTIILFSFIAGLLYAVFQQPRQYDFAKDKIIKTTLKGQAEFSVSEIASVKYGQKKPKTSSRYGSPILHFIEISFSGKKKFIHIDQTISDFPIDDIAEYVKKNYPVEGRFTQVGFGKR